MAADAAATDASPEPEDWVFGYGSIMNNLSRQTTAAKGASSAARAEATAVLAFLRPCFGVVRCWNFRSSTGFTAVGLRERAQSELACRTCGVLFPVQGSMDAFDLRERGYERRTVALDDFELSSHDSLSILRGARLWVYVPLGDSRRAASADFPICQTYIDTVLQGCLAWGGLDLAREWVATTFDWSTFYLNDAPLSRRPWLHRERYAEIDEALVQRAEWTRFADRRHPEEFASHWMAGLRGMWGVPPRNMDFVGREAELERIWDTLRRAKSAGDGSAGVTTVEASGFGGVGKTQVAIEYCHRRYQADSEVGGGYGLIIWLHAESSDSIAAGLRRLAADSGIAVRDKNNEQVIDEIRSRLYRTGCPWLLVFDNVEREGVLDTYLPSGGYAAGHVLVTCRRILPGVPPDRRLSLDCFSPAESVDFLGRAAGAHAYDEVNAERSPSAQRAPDDVGPQHVTIGLLLADALGHLPLALAIAAAYMSHCDATCAEYYGMLNSSGASGFFDSERQKLAAYPMGVRGSLLLSLERIREEALKQKRRVSTRAVLDCLGFLAPVGLTRPLVRLLVQQLLGAPAAPPARRRPPVGAAAAAVAVVGGGLALLAPRARRRLRRWAPAAAAVGAFVAAAWLVGERGRPTAEDAGGTDTAEAVDDAAEADNAWMLLKDFSLLTVRQRVGSMHRLLQQLLRALQTREQAAIAASCCVATLRSLWCFDPADTTTWAESALIWEHIKTVGRHVDEVFSMRAESSQAIDASSLAFLTPLANLLTEGALYMSMALSRFEEANAALEMAGRFHSARRSGADVDLANTWHTRGKVARYRGRLAEAHEHLARALEARRRLARFEAKHQWDVASTLHEIGVLYLKECEIEVAHGLLTESLEMKRSLRAHCVPMPSARHHRFSDEAATLHQLAVSAMLAKPSRLSEAERLLREALAMETSGNPFARGARAASLQQLARVEIRRGLLDAARGHLEEALALHREAYGHDTPHVNVATVRVQLGKVSCALGKRAGWDEATELLEEAESHLLEALRIQRQIYSASGAWAKPRSAAPGEPTSALEAGCDHQEIAATLGQLGALERARGSSAAAKRYFAQQREMILRLLYQATGGSSLEQVASTLRPPVAPQVAQILRSLQAATQWERTATRDVGDAAGARALAASLKLLERLAAGREAPASEASGDEGARRLEQSELCRACASCRERVRERLVEAKKSCSGAPQQFFDDVASELEQAAQRCGEESNEAAFRMGAAAVAAAAAEFARELRAPSSDKFAACDAMRSALRHAGVARIS